MNHARFTVVPTHVAPPGCVAEIFGIHFGIQETVPGMFFELVLPFWLFFKGSIPRPIPVQQP